MIAEYFENIQDLIKQKLNGNAEIKSKNGSLQMRPKESSVNFDVRRGRIINPEYEEIDLSLEFFVDNLEKNYLCKTQMIPIRRTASIFNKDTLNIEKSLVREEKNKINYTHKISFFKTNFQEEELAETILGIIKYNDEFIQLNKQLLNGKEKLNETWRAIKNNNYEELNTEENLTETTIIKQIPYEKQPDTLFIVADYVCPENLTTLQKAYMFPSQRLNGVFRQAFPSPTPFTYGKPITTLPFLAKQKLPEQNGKHRQLYEITLNKDASDAQKILGFKHAENFIKRFVALHHDAYKNAN